MTTSNFNMRMDTETKERLTQVLTHYGLTIPQAFKLFANQAIKTGRLPLSFDWGDTYYPNAATEQAMREAIAERSTAKRYDSPEEMMEDLMKEIMAGDLD